MLSSTWIPLEQPYEQLLIDVLVRQQRCFVKPLRFESRQGARFANAVLLETGDAQTPLHIVTPFMAERDRSAKEQAIGKRSAPGWVWRMDAEQEPPALPRAASAERPLHPAAAEPAAERARTEQS